MALSEIEKLERRYAENPQGLTFAPLAEVHRKNGDVTRALELLRPGLTHHPDYIPASIVLGRCHLDLGELPAAETAFTHVLALDGENVIALKALADITERQGRFDEAERWLRTLLAIDRSNDDARDQLGRVEATRRQTSTAALVDIPDTSEPVDLPAAEATTPEETPDAAVTAETFVLDDAPLDLTPPPAREEPAERIMGWVAETGSVEAAEAVPLDLEELDVGIERHDEVVTEGPRPEGIELDQPAMLGDTVTPLAGLVGREEGLDVGSFDHASDFRVEMAEDIVLNSSGGSEFQMANASEELLAMREPPAPPPDPAEPSPVVESVFGADDEPARTATQDDSTSRTPASSDVPADEAKEPATSERAPDEIAIGEPPSAELATSASGDHIGTDAAASEPALEPVATESSSVEPAAEEPITAEAPVPEWARPMSPVAEDRRSLPQPIGRHRGPGRVTRSLRTSPLPLHPRRGHRPWPSRRSPEPQAAAMAEPPVAEPVPPAEPDLVMTASMAELLLQQGHPVEALTVYRLLETRGGMPRYADKIAELERLTAPPEPPAPAPRPEPVPPAPLPAYSVQVTRGQSAQAFLKGVLTARPPAVSPGAAVHASAARPGMADPEGAPTRPAHDSLSLSSVFGEESTPTMPAVSAGAAAAPAGGVSYDEFFGGAGSAAAPRPARAPDPKSDDLDQFHTWLQNLKR